MVRKGRSVPKAIQDPRDTKGIQERKGPKDRKDPRDPKDRRDRRDRRDRKVTLESLANTTMTAMMIATTATPTAYPNRSKCPNRIGPGQPQYGR